MQPVQNYWGDAIAKGGAGTATVKDRAGGGGGGGVQGTHDDALEKISMRARLSSVVVERLRVSINSNPKP